MSLQLFYKKTKTKMSRVDIEKKECFSKMRVEYLAQNPESTLDISAEFMVPLKSELPLKFFKISFFKKIERVRKRRKDLKKSELPLNFFKNPNFQLFKKSELPTFLKNPNFLAKF